MEGGQTNKSEHNGWGQTNKSENNGWGQTNDIVAQTDKVINLIE
jgi:hypothetical protein